MDKKIIIFCSLCLLAAGCASYGKLQRTSEKYGDIGSFFSGKGITSCEGEPRGLYFDGRQWLDRSLELIADANDYILINSFLVTEHRNSIIVLDALRKKMDEGVRVYCMFDSASYYRTYPRSKMAVRSAIPYVRELGIPCAEYNPIRGRRVFSLLGLFDRDHRKYWVVDGEVVVLGGQNIDYDSLRFPEEGGCIDTMVEISSAGLAEQMIDSFVSNWNSYALDKIDRNDFSVRAETSGWPMWVFDQGPSDADTVTSMFDGFFTFADEEIWMVQCYSFVTPSLLDKVRFASDRGVRVNFIISENQVGERFEKASLYSIKSLIDAGAAVYLYNSPTGSLLHYKLILSDKRMASIGSANFNFRSQALSRELSVVLTDSDSIETVNRNLESILSCSRPVSASESEKYRGPSYFANYFLMQFWG